MSGGVGDGDGSSNSKYNTLSECRLGIIGCGTMGRCIVAALLESGILQATQIKASVHHPETQEKLQSRFTKISVTTNNLEVCQWATTILLCLKPQIVGEVVTDEPIREALAGKVIISIAAGVRLTQYEQWLPASRVIRAMPNTPCQIREGMVVLSAGPSLDSASRQQILHLLGPLGRCRFLSDHHLDAVTALSGSGPAFACVILEALADGGVMMGLPREVAVQLAAQSLQGAARMVLQTGMHPAQIKDTVTTPAGCTIAGILTMEDGKIRSVLARTIEEATKVAASLGQKKA